jgi:hypothetical protein
MIAAMTALHAPSVFRMPVVVLVAIVSLFNLAPAAHAQQLRWSALTSGYEEADGAGIALRSVVGQNASESSHGGGLSLHHGIMHFGVTSSGPPPGATFVVTTTADDGPGSFRAAILAANVLPGADLITFNIPGDGVRTIVPLTPLPAITESVRIDGYSQPGAALNSSAIEDGTNAVIRIEVSGQTAGGTGLQIEGGTTTVRGLAINRFVTGIAISQAGGNIVEGCFIGMDPTGIAALPNTFGITITSPGNRLGGATPGTRNVVSGNQARGVAISGTGSTGNHVLGNYIGTTASGSGDLSNGMGIYIAAGANVIGGPDLGSRNIVLGAVNPAIYLETGQAGGNIIQHNYIGTNAAGTAGLTNAGITVFTGGNHIRNNVVSGNRGILLQEVPATANVITGNLIGLAASGDVALGNNGGGISLLRANGNRIGGTTSEDRNVIATTNHGIWITTANDNIVQGNFVGTNVAGSAMVIPGGGSGSGVWINGNGNLIGGIEPGARNVISGSHTGVLITGGAVENVVQGNYIGTSADGMVALPNSNQGVHIVTPQGSQTTRNNLIGGTASGAGNLISGNTLRGVWLVGAEEITVQGNTIGISADGTTPLPNNSHGIEVWGGGNNMIGGASPGAGNRIAYNGLGQQQIAANGVTIQSSTGNAILGNLIYRNRRLAIDLVGGTENSFGVTENDATDSDTGPNNLQNYPLLTSASSSGDRVLISGSITSTANTQYRIEFFSAPVPDTSTHGGAWIYLGHTMIATGEGHSRTFTAELSGALSVGHFVTATATDPGNNTSEFSARIPVASGTTASEDVLPLTFSLGANYPNPFRNGTTIEYRIAGHTHVDVRVFDTMGRQVAVLVDEGRQAGIYSVRWDSGDLAAGIYFCRMWAGDYRETRTLLKLH